MTRFSLGRRFERVLIPYNGLCCLLEPTAVRSCLEHAREHLAPGGRLALDVYRADDLHHDAPDDQGEEDDDEPVVAIDHGDRIYRVYEESSWQRAPQRLDTCYRFVPADGGEILEQTLCQRYLLANELEELVSDAGLVVVERAGGFAGEPLDDEADELVLVAERKP
jgi:O-methyltransferase involved in polyketide biosynthesis